jgi:hypothetical protein
MPQLAGTGRLINPPHSGETAEVPAWVLSGASLDIDLANNRAWSAAAGETTPATFLSIARASTGLALDSAGAWTSFATDTLRRTDLGLLIELARTNVLQQSTDLANAAWAATSCTVTGGQTAPDGTTNAATLLDVAASSNHFIGNATVSFTSGTTYVLIVRAKAGTGSFLQLTFQTTRFSSGPYANFNLSTGAAGSTGGTVVASGIISEGDGWYCCYLAATATSTGTGQSVIARINAGTDARLPTYTGNANTVLAWNPAVFSGSQIIINSPFYTTGSSAARSADNVTVSAAAKTLMNAAKSAYVETRRLVGGTAPRIIDWGGTASLRASSGPAGTTVATVGASTATATIGGSGTVTSLVKSAFNFDGTDNEAIANGGTQATTAGAWGVTTEDPQIGNLAALTNALNGYIGRMTFSTTPNNFDGMTV